MFSILIRTTFSTCTYNNVFVFHVFHVVNRLTVAVTSILNPSERNEQTENSEENPLPPQVSS